MNNKAYDAISKLFQRCQDSIESLDELYYWVDETNLTEDFDIDPCEITEFLIQQGITPQEILDDWKDDYLVPCMFKDIWIDDIKIPDSVKYLSEGAFESSHIKSIEIKHPVNIMYGAFQECGVKDVLEIPAGSDVDFTAFIDSIGLILSIPRSILKEKLSLNPDANKEQVLSILKKNGIYLLDIKIREGE